MTYREAVREAIREAIAKDDRVFLMGEDVGRYGGCFAVSKGLLEEFGPQRIRDTPLSESAFVGAGIGAALGGMRPIVEIMTVNFSLLAADQILNNAATYLHMSGGLFNVPLVIRHHSDTSGRPGSRDGVRCHLPAPGGAGWFWQGDGAALGRTRHVGDSSGAHGHPGGRPPRH
jgi:pyruvate/2-oxoglutarate/acetoin dehydrogenase E1 component